MGRWIPLLFAVVFAAAALIDIRGHKKRELIRQTPDRIFLGALFAGLGVSLLIFFAGGRMKEEPDNTGVYVAYKYLLEEDPDAAEEVAVEDDHMDSDSREMIRILARAESGDARNAFFESASHMEKPGMDAGQMRISGVVHHLASESLESGSKEMPGVLKLVKESFSLTGIQETDSLLRLFETDKAIRRKACEEITAADMEEVRSLYPGNDFVQKIAVSYYMFQDDFDSAEALARDIADRFPTEKNIVLYTDVLAQEMYRRGEKDLARLQDDEVKPLLEKAENARIAVEDVNGNDLALIEEKLEEADTFDTDAANVFYQRLINYLLLKKNQGMDTEGRISLQLAKLKTLSGQRSEATKELTGLLNRLEDLNNTSEIWPYLVHVQETLEEIARIQAGSESGEFKTLNDAMELLFSRASGSIFSFEGSNINDKVYKELAAALYADQPVIRITDAESPSYPKITVRFSMNQQKHNIVGGYGEFYSDDFTFTDSGAVTTDVKLTAGSGDARRSVAVVLDLQKKVPKDLEIDSLKQALGSISEENKMAEEWALVNSSSYMQSALADDALLYRYAVRNINIGYPVSAYSCFSTAADILSGVSGENEKMILYVTDGSSMSEEEILQTISMTQEKDITVCALVIGVTGDEGTLSLCTSTGGIEIVVPYYEQLPSFAEYLATLLDNRYVADFTANSSSAGAGTFTITLNQDGTSATTPYAGGGS